MRNNTRTRKGNKGLRIGNVSYNFSLFVFKDNATKYQCQKHYKELILKEGIFCVESENGILKFYQFKG